MELKPQNLNPEKRQVRCVLCNNSWLEQLSLRQYKEDWVVKAGNQFAGWADEIFILKCPKCNQLILPPLDTNVDPSRKKFFMEAMKELGIDLEPKFPELGSGDENTGIK